ncbi:hypothetical protein E2C01_041381 [Portunus trituberculatus]|uniref:Uncharacterized protein n=1 Tax=Portunus trituberculatus TaxID=210409 RepID=A0A5B7FJ45_PORTR|nr:hypothetical protein [Portunus trituberculatus]
MNTTTATTATTTTHHHGHIITTGAWEGRMGVVGGSHPLTLSLSLSHPLQESTAFFVAGTPSQHQNARVHGSSVCGGLVVLPAALTHYYEELAADGRPLRGRHSRPGIPRAPPDPSLNQTIIIVSITPAQVSVGGRCDLINPFGTKTRFHIHSAYYLLQTLKQGIKIVRTLAINLLSSIDPF